MLFALVYIIHLMQQIVNYEKTIIHHATNYHL